MTGEWTAIQLPEPAAKAGADHHRSMETCAAVFAEQILDHLRSIHKAAMPEGTRSMEFEKWLAFYYSKHPCDTLTGDLVRAFEQVCGKESEQALIKNIDLRLKSVYVQEMDYHGVKFDIRDE